jgi:prefoldin alpha subunit
MIAMAKKHDQENLQNKYIELQLLKQQITALVEQKQQLDERFFELNTTIDALEKMGKIKGGDEIWSQIGSGTFVKSDIKDTENVLVAVGAGVVVSETRHRASEILKGRAHEIETISNEMVKQANDYLERASKLEPELEKLANQQSKEGQG